MFFHSPGNVLTGRTSSTVSYLPTPVSVSISNQRPFSPSHFPPHQKLPFKKKPKKKTKTYLSQTTANPTTSPNPTSAPGSSPKRKCAIRSRIARAAGSSSVKIPLPSSSSSSSASSHGDDGGDDGGDVVHRSNRARQTGLASARALVEMRKVVVGVWRW